MGFWQKMKKMGKCILKAAPIVISVASAITAVTPNPTDDAIVIAVHKTLDILSLHVGYNAQDNEDDN